MGQVGRVGPFGRVLVGTADVLAVGFYVPIAEWLSSRQLARHEALQALGPDLLAGAGIGNVFKSEILFLAGVAPFTPVAALTDTDLERIVSMSREQLAANVLDRSKTLSSAIGRRTMRSLASSSR